MKFDVTQPQTASTEKEWTPLATGQYLMRIAAAKIEPSPFANDDGEFPDRLTVRWSLAEWNQDFDDAGYQDGQTVFQQFNPWYGESKKGPSKFKQFIDPLISEGLIPAQFEIATEDTPDTEGDLIGITRHVMVECYAKTMGPNKGQPGNRVLAVTAPKTQRGTVKEVIKNGGKVSLDDVDADDRTLTPPPDSDGATLTELRNYAKQLAKSCGGIWNTKKDWDSANDAMLRARISRMEKELDTPRAEEDTEPLFA